jgi:hypothetical protein
MIISDNFMTLRLFLTKGEYIVRSVGISNNMEARVITDNTSFVKANTYTNINNAPIYENSIISQNWFYTTFPDEKKMAKHTYTISTYSDNTLSNKIGEITFGSNLLDHGEQGIILAGEDFDQLLNVQTLFVQSAYGIYDKIHKVLLINALFFTTNEFLFVKKY